MIEANIKIVTTVREYILSSITISPSGIKGTEAHSNRQIKEIPLDVIMSITPYQQDVIGIICNN